MYRKSRIDSLRRRIAALDDPEAERVRLLVKLGAAYEAEAGDLEAAARAYEEAHLIDDEAPGVFEGLARVYEAKQDWARLVETLQSQSDLVDDDRVRAALQRRLARVHVERLGDHDAAVVALRDALDAAPDDTEAFTTLRAMLEKSGAHMDVVDLLYEQHDAAETIAARRRWLREIAAVYRDRLGDEDAAEDVEQEIADLT